MERIHLYTQLLLFSFLMIGCTGNSKERQVSVASFEVAKEEAAPIIPGADRIALYFPLLKDKKVACVVNNTSLVGNLHLVDTLLKMNVDIANTTDQIIRAFFELGMVIGSVIIKNANNKSVPLENL